MDKIIERLLISNLDGAESITTTVTRENGTRAHYYIFKQDEKNTNQPYVEIPLWIYTKVNGKGKDSHFITVAMSDEGYVVHDLNKEHTVKPISMKTIGLPIDEAEEMDNWPEPIPLEETDIFDNLSTQQIKRCIGRLEYELEQNKKAEEILINDPLPF